MTINREIYQDIIDQFHGCVQLDASNNLVSVDLDKAHQNLNVLMILCEDEAGFMGSESALANALALVGEIYQPVFDRLASRYQRPVPTYNASHIKPSDTVVHEGGPTNSL